MPPDKTTAPRDGVTPTLARELNFVRSDDVNGLLLALVRLAAPGAHVATTYEHIECVDDRGFNWGKYTVRVERESAMTKVGDQE